MCCPRLSVSRKMFLARVREFVQEYPFFSPAAPPAGKADRSTVGFSAFAPPISDVAEIERDQRAARTTSASTRARPYEARACVRTEETWDRPGLRLSRRGAGLRLSRRGAASHGCANGCPHRAATRRLAGGRAPGPSTRASARRRAGMRARSATRTGARGRGPRRRCTGTARSTTRLRLLRAAAEAAGPPPPRCCSRR